MSANWILIAALVGAASMARADGPITVTELRARGVLGELGEPLGKIVVVTAVVVDGNSLRTKEASGALYLRITRVGERTLASPALLSVADRSQLKPGQTLRCAGYETGGFSGIVPHEFEYIEAYAAYGYTFKTHWVVLKVVEP